MKNAGAIVVIVAGLSGAIGAGYEIVVLLDDMAVYGWRALAFCAALVALGAAAIKAKKGRPIGVLVILCAIAASLVFGSPLVVVFMAQAVIGALMMLFGGESRRDAQSPAS